MSYGGNFNYGGGFDNSNNYGSSQQYSNYGGTGGGYMASPGNVDSTDSPKKSRSGAANVTLVPLTIKQLHSAHQAHPDDAFKVDGKELNQVTIVGVIQKATEQSTNMTFVVDDGTGQIDVRIWLDSDDQNDTFTASQKALWTVNTYVRVIGHLRSFQGKRSVVAFRIQPITDFDEVTFHFLEVITVHNYNVRSASTNTTSSSNFSYPASNNTSGGLNSVILQVIRQTSDPAGISVHTLAAQLGKSEMDIRNALEFLAGEGQVYSTVDEDHFQVTEFH